MPSEYPQLSVPTNNIDIFSPIQNSLMNMKILKTNELAPHNNPIIETTGLTASVNTKWEIP